MATINWPSSLGSPRVDGFSFSQPYLLEQQATHRGAPRLRRRKLSRPVDISLSFWFTASQLSTFETFYWQSLNAGTNDVRMNIHTYFGPLPVVMIFYPYSLRFDAILGASEVSFDATYIPPPITLFAVL